MRFNIIDIIKVGIITSLGIGTTLFMVNRKLNRKESLCLVICASLFSLIVIGVDRSIGNVGYIENYENPIIPSYNKEFQEPKDHDLIEKKKRDAVTSDAIKKKQTDDMRYDEGNPLNTVPLGDNIYNDYTYLPPANWLRPFERPPVCVAQKECPVCPIYTGGTNIDLLQYDDSNNVTPAIKLNKDYYDKK